METVTIAARSDLDRARILKASYLEHNPTHKFAIVLVDNAPAEVKIIGDDDSLTSVALSLPDDAVARMSADLDRSELRALLKPWVIELLLERGAIAVCYLDADTKIVGSLDEVERLSEDHGTVVTLRSRGAHDTGFVVATNQSRPMLSWWQRQILDVSGEPGVVSAEQRAFDLVPELFDHYLLQDSASHGFVRIAQTTRARSASRVAVSATHGIDPVSKAETGTSGQLLRRSYRRARRSVARLTGARDQMIGALAEGLVQIGGIVDADRRQRVQAMQALRRRIRTLERRVAADREASNRRIEELARTTERIDQLLKTLDAEQQAAPFVAPETSVRDIAPDGVERLSLGGNDGSAYADFEDTYRGSEAFVSERLTPYLDLVTEGPVLDVGCGRGEFLALLKSAGIPARGIDLDASMVARAQAKKLDVVEGDALVELDRMEPESLAAITSFQVIEHIDVRALREFLLRARRVLRPGGLLIAETVNPHSPAALKTFWLDLTHVRPLFPESLLFLARECGFDEAQIRFPMGRGNLDDDLRQCGEYALVARAAPKVP